MTGFTTSSEQWHPDAAFWNGRSVAVTGATGFVGGHLTAKLVQLGASVVILRRDDVPSTPMHKGWTSAVSVVTGSLEDLEVVERLLVEYQVGTVFHLAAQSQVGVANSNPRSTFETNIRGTWNLFEAARRAGSACQVLIASSDKAYGSQPELPYTEESPLLAIHPYDVSKACADLISSCYARCFDVPAVVTRCGNFFGPGDLNWARLVPGTIRSVLRGERPLIRSDGTMVRDYLYVEDGVRAYLMLAEHLQRDPSISGLAFNFSLEEPLSVLDLVARVQEAAGTALQPEIQATARHEIQDQYLSAARARSLVGWSAAFPLNAALVETVDWYRRYLQGG